MRLVTTFSQKDPNPHAYSSLLASEGIEHTLEEHRENNENITQVWVVDEDQIDRAQLLLERFRKNPKDIPERPVASFSPSSHASTRQPSLRPKGIFTVSILTLCVLLFFWSLSERPKQPSNLQGLVPSPALSEMEKKLIFDYPLYFQLKDELFAVKDKDETKAEEIYNKLLKMKPWMGITYQIMQHRKMKSALVYEGTLFEKIRKGEIWRVVTPVLLHLDFLHIFFNLLWFLILAPQIEERIGFFRITLLFLLGAIIPNIAQYLISGPFFMGISGVICAFAAFIYARQKVAPWEGYLLQKMTLVVLFLFILGLFALSFSLFWLQYFSIISFALPIANTAHVVGAVVGYLLGKSKLFASHI